MEELALKREMKTLKGIEAREKMASELKEKRTQEVVKMMVNLYYFSNYNYTSYFSRQEVKIL